MEAAVEQTAPPSGFREGIRLGVPFAVPAFFLAISFGVLARTLGWGAAAPIVMSLIIFSGSAQFAIASVLGAGGGAPAALLAAVLVNARFLPMGVAIAPALKGGPLRRAVEGQALVDASWALASKGGGRFDRELLIGATLPQWAGWISGTVIGALSGDLLGDPDALGLDAIFPAFFLALLFEESHSRLALTAAALAGAIAIALVPVAPVGVPIVAASVAALIGLRGPR
jgi:4-azaleucine resistance transporter AzlC